MYLKLDAADWDAKAAAALPSMRERAAAGASLLARPIAVLLAEIDAARTAAVLADSARLAAALSGEGDGEEAAGEGEEGRAPAEATSELWVDKYAPRVFTELLSDETTNRQVLQWLKAWDGCVFGDAKAAQPAGKAGAPAAARAAASAAALAAAGGRGPTGRGSAGRGVGRGAGRGDAAAAYARQAALERAAAAKPQIGPDGRPVERLLLMCGPPGLGKTTLAHVVAKHCGYRVVDVNASDERGAAALRTRLLDASQMAPLTGDRRPTCVVLDEIDGALAGSDGRGALEAVVALARAEARSDDAGDGDAAPEGAGSVFGAAPGARKSRRAAPTLLRPVLCICNDLMAPALRPLREAARVFRFAAPSPARLAARLRDIAAREGLRAEPRAFAALAERTQCDVRAALHALQLLSRLRRPIRVADVATAVGAKDLTVGPMDAWRALLTKPRAGARADPQGGTDWRRTTALLQAVGEHELVLAGLHENLAAARYADTLLTRSADALAQLSDADVLVGRAHVRLPMIAPCLRY